MVDELQAYKLDLVHKRRRDAREGFLPKWSMREEGMRK